MSLIKIIIIINHNNYYNYNRTKNYKLTEKIQCCSMSHNDIIIKHLTVDYTCTYVCLYTF